MAKKFIIYASSTDLASCPVVQNEVGKYYRNSAGVYYKPILSQFDTAVLPAGYTTYIGGSHAKYISNVNRNPIDFSLVAGTILSMNVDVNVIASNGTDDWIKVTPVGSSYIIAFVHTYQFSKGLVKAGSPICKIAPSSVTDYPPHLHMDDWSGLGRKVRHLILNGDYQMDTFKAGDKIIFTDVQNIRKGSGTDFEITGSTTVGMIATIEGVPRVANGYTWYDLVNNNWVADTGKFKLYTEPTPPPIDPCKELKDRLVTLEAEIKGLKEALVASQDKLKVAEDRVIFLEQDKETWEGQMGELEKEVVDAKDKAVRFEKQYIETVTELNELKQGRDNWLNRLADMLHKLFSGAK